MPTEVKIGEVQFELRGDTQLLKQLSAAFPDRGTPWKNIKLNLTEIEGTNDFEQSVDTLLNLAYKEHNEHLYVDAALLADAYGQMILVAGSSGSGKTTLSVAAGLTGTAKLVSEDICLFKDGFFLSIQTPLSIRPYTVDLIAQLGCSLHMYDERWALLPQVFTGNSLPATQLKAILFLQDTGPESAEINELTDIEAMVRLLPISNALTRESHYTALEGITSSSSRRLSVKGGSLPVRMRIVSDLFTS